MNAERFIARRISRQGKGNISRPIVKIGIAGIAIGMAVMILSVAIVLGFKNEIVSRITGLTSHITVTSVNTHEGGEAEPICLRGDTLKVLAENGLTKSISPVAFKHGILKTKTDNEGLLVKGVSADFDFSNFEKYLVKGRLIEFDTAQASKEIMVSENLCRKMSIDLNDKLVVYFIVSHRIIDSVDGGEIIKTETRSRDFKVCGIFRTSFADFDDKLSVIDLKQVQKLNYWKPGMCGAYEILLNRFDSLDIGAERIEDQLGYHYKVGTVTESYFNIFIWLDKLDVNGIIIIILMIVVATINMITALLILILERTNMIGMVKAFGMTNSNVRRVFLFVGARLIFRGLFWGNLAGLGLCLIQKQFKLVSLNPETYYVDHVAITLHWPLFIALNIVTVLVCTVMLIFPTLIIARLTPVKTIKFD